MVDIVNAACYLVYLSYHKNRSSLTPLKLQKLLYLAQGWSYVWDGKPLFLSQFEAWQYGPVSTDVYNRFKKYGRDEIPIEEGVSTIGDDEAEETLEAVWDSYGGYSAFELVKLTHRQQPWRNAYESGKIIRNDDIKQYFQSTY